VRLRLRFSSDGDDLAHFEDVYNLGRRIVNVYLELARAVSLLSGPARSSLAAAFGLCTSQAVEYASTSCSSS
jgi:hypothetical protein